MVRLIQASLLSWVVGCTAAFAQPLVFSRDLPLVARVERAGADYTGDGVEELTGWWAPFPRQSVFDGRTGQVLRTWTGLRGISPHTALAPDADGDARPEFVFTVPESRHVFVVSSRSPGGDLNEIPSLWRIDGAHAGNMPRLGEHVAVTGGRRPRVLVGAGSDGRALVADPATGEVVARLSRDPSTLDQASFGLLVADAGDLNGDGIHDFAIGAPGRYPGSHEGRVYLLDGRTRTTEDVAVTDLSANAVLGIVRSNSHVSMGLAFGEPFAALGDPYPDDRLRQTLLLVGAQYAGIVGGATAALVTHQPRSGIEVRNVAEWVSDGRVPYSFGQDVQAIGDVNGDGVSDAAILESGDGSHVERGRVLIVSGAGLLDGFDAAVDVLQEITDPRLTISSSVRYLGDYDGDGRGDLAISMSGPESLTRIYSVVPEPTAIMLASGLATILLARRKRRSVGRSCR